MCQQFNVHALEQPFGLDPQHDGDAWTSVRQACHAASLDVYADESFCVESDVDRLAAFVSGVNIKLEKCGGVRAALCAALRAKRANKRVWLGTMVGSTLNSTIVAHLLPMSDAGGDLDGSLLVAPHSDRFDGGLQWLADGTAALDPSHSGLGISRKNTSVFD